MEAESAKIELVEVESVKVEPMEAEAIEAEPVVVESLDENSLHSEDFVSECTKKSKVGRKESMLLKGKLKAVTLFSYLLFCFKSAVDY